MREQLRHNLLLQFSLVSLVSVVIIATILVLFLGRSLRERVLNEVSLEAQDTLSQRVTSRLTPEDVFQGVSGERYAELDRFVQDSVVSARTARIKIWNRQGIVVYSTDPAQVGQGFPIKSSLQQALAGGVAREISVPKDVENQRERLLGTLLEVYVPIRFSGSAVPDGSLEIYQYYAPYDSFIKSQQRLILLVVFVGFLLLYVSLVFLVSRGWFTIVRQQNELDRDKRELSALNRLLQGHLVQRQDVLDRLQGLASKIPAGMPTREECKECSGLIIKLAEEAAAFPAFSHSDFPTRT
ncbi:MAG: hypothetical protein HYX82_04860 [Chloroflexi bacterium]|nr:hypothetical protein [Chloroflexota bacterium]